LLMEQRKVMDGWLHGWERKEAVAYLGWRKLLILILD
jgi:hypothetical protein